MRILIDCALGKHAQGVATVLRNNPTNEDVYIVGADMNVNDKAIYYDKTYQVPPIVDDNYVDAILNICNKENIDLYIPWSVLELEKLIDNKDRFVNTKLMITASKQSIQTLAHKINLYDYLKNNNYPYLPYHVVNSEDDIKNVIDKTWICKIDLGEGGRGVVKINNYIPNNIQYPSVLQEFVPIDCLYISDIIAHNGDIVNYYTRKSCYRSSIQTHQIVECKSIEDIVRRLIKETNYDGLINIQFIKKDNEYYITDVNPRLWGPIEASYLFGGNMLWEAIELFMNGHITHKAKYNVLSTCTINIRKD